MSYLGQSGTDKLESYILGNCDVSEIELRTESDELFGNIVLYFFSAM